MKFEINEKTVQDMIAIYGKEYAIREIVAGYRAALEIAIEELEEKNEQ